MKTFSEIVADRLEELGATAYGVETAHNLPPDSIRNVLRKKDRGGDGVTLNKVRMIADALGLEFYVGPPRAQELPAPPVELKADQSDYALIARYSVNVSAGPGLVPVSEEIDGRLAFSKSWLTRQGINPTLCCVVRVDGDSMAPTVPLGAFVLVHTLETDVHSEGIYAFSRDGEACVKRLIPLGRQTDGRPQSLVIMSDNPNYKPELLTEEAMNHLRIVGRVRSILISI